MRRLSAAAAHALAAEFVLGTLRGRARERFAELARHDRELRAVVSRWERALTPLADAVEPIEPPQRVWRNIAERIAPRSGAAANGVPAFWRTLGLMAGGLASALVAAFLWLSAGPRGEPLFVAVLTAADQVPRMVVSMHEPDVMRVRVVKPWSGMDNRSLELWALAPGGGKPRSLGLVHNAVGDTMMKVARTDPRMKGMTTLAVSMEPMGGSPTGEPTGAVVCAGPIAPVRPA